MQIKDVAKAGYIPLRSEVKKGPYPTFINKDLDVIALGNSIGTGKNGISESVLQVNSFDELEQKKDLVKGKIVFYNYKFNDTYINTFLSYRDAGQYRGQGPSRAAKYGAKAVIVRSMSHAADNNPHTGATRYDSAYTNGHFLPDTIGHNIIGEFRGSEFPDEIITVGGHLDSWDNCEGAHDDGAGCVQTIEILRAFKAIGYKPKRSIRFVLFANEENGLRGGNKYAEEAQKEGKKHILAVESDAGGFTPRALGFSGRSDVFEAVNKRELELGAVNMAALIYLVDKYGL